MTEIYWKINIYPYSSDIFTIGLTGLKKKKNPLNVPFTHQFGQVEYVRCRGADPESTGKARHLLRDRCHRRAPAILQRNEWSNGATGASFQCPLETWKTCSVWTHPTWGERRCTSPLSLSGLWCWGTFRVCGCSLATG